VTQSSNRPAKNDAKKETVARVELSSSTKTSKKCTATPNLKSCRSGRGENGFRGGKKRRAVCF
jgi:hypothetical protein